MPTFTPQALATVLDLHLPPTSDRKFCIGFSGGLDSSVLLHALAELRSERSWQLRAVHVDHQLHSASSAWADHCRRIADQLGVELSVERVRVAQDHPNGLEAAARGVRYAALRRNLRDAEILLTAHHADDQAETMLLALLRGSGVPGLAAMPFAKSFARGLHVRPLLSFRRFELEAWAAVRDIESVNDPSNTLLRHDRNFLRHELLPVLVRRWPAAVENIGRSAGHLGEARGLLDELASADLRNCILGRSLRISALRELTPARCRNVLRYWFRANGCVAPSTRKLTGLTVDLFNSRADRVASLGWQGAQLHWYRGLLYVEATASSDAGRPFTGEDLSWTTTEPLELPANLGRLCLTPTADRGFSLANLPTRLTVRFRRGGEKIRLPGRAHRSSLRNLLQERHVLPWWRDRIPLVFAGRTLLAVGNLFSADEFAARPGEVGVGIAWEGVPDLLGVPSDEFAN